MGTELRVAVAVTAGLDWRADETGLDNWMASAKPADCDHHIYKTPTYVLVRLLHPHPISSSCAGDLCTLLHRLHVFCLSYLTPAESVDFSLPLRLHSRSRIPFEMASTMAMADNPLTPKFAPFFGMVRYPELCLLG